MNFWLLKRFCPKFRNAMYWLVLLVWLKNAINWLISLTQWPKVPLQWWRRNRPNKKPTILMLFVCHFNLRFGCIFLLQSLLPLSLFTASIESSPECDEPMTIETQETNWIDSKSVCSSFLESYLFKVDNFSRHFVQIELF